MAKKRKKRGRPPKKQSLSLNVKREHVVSIIQVVIFLLAALIPVSFLRQGTILVRLNDALMEQVSWTAVLIPFILLSLGFLISKLKNPLGQANVLVGSMLFYLSILTLVRAGKLGISAWEGISALITGIGAAIVLTGTALVGAVIMFDTSVDKVLEVTATLLIRLRRYLVGDKEFKKAPGTMSGKRELKILGGNDSEPSHTKQPVAIASAPASGQKEQVPNGKNHSADELSGKIVSNLPGDDAVWKYPPLDLLSSDGAGRADRGDIRSNAATIERTLDSFGITAKVIEVNQGPTVTQYALEVALGTKLSKITTLDRDLALALAAPNGTIRIEAPIPGRSLVGIELPNRSAEFVPLKRMLDSDVMRGTDSKLAVVLGLDVSGKPIVADLGKMPHVLIAGQTGSGKSVCVNSMIASLLFRSTPSEVKLILVDPKRVELTGYNGIPHLLTPVIVEPDKVVSALRWVMAEMDRRYKLFAQAGARNIASYNEMSGFQALPYIVLIIDELADIMLFAPNEVEDSITRIAQMSRATGIHMALATQRPSVDVITGLIKANIPSRIAFAVASQVDSRVILDTQGAEKLLGKGDMLYLVPENAKPQRIQGAFVSDKELNNLISFIRNQGLQPQYTEEVTEMPKPGTTKIGGIEEDVDDLFNDAVALACQYDKASASLLQRRLSVGYARAARILDQLEAAGVVGGADGSKPREVLIKDPSQLTASDLSA